MTATDLIPARPVNGGALLIGLAAAVAACLGAVAVYSPKTAIGALLVVALVVLAFVRLPLAVGLFVVLTFPQHLPGSLGVGSTVAKPFGIILAISWLAAAVTRGDSVALLPRDQPVLFWCMSAFVVLATVSTSWAPDFAHAQYQLTRLVLAMLFLLVVYTAASTPQGLKTVLWAYLAGSALTSVYSIAVGGYGSNGRLDALFDPNFFATELILAIVVACFLLLTTSGWARVLAALILVLDCTAFALTQSRGGIAGLGVGLLAAVVLAGRARSRVVALVLALAAVAIGYYIVFSPSHLHGTFAGSLASSSSGRSDEWRIALRMLEHHVLNGVGLGNFVVVEPSYATQSINLNFVRLVVSRPLVAHNSYLEVAAELGIVGLFLFVAIVAIPIRLAYGALSRLATSFHEVEFYARGLLAGALGVFVAVFFLSAEYEKQLWLTLALLACIPALARRAEPPGTGAHA